MPDFLLDLLIFFPACPSPGMIPCKDIQEIHRLKTHCRGQIPTAVISDTDYYMRLSVASLLEGERSGEQGENRVQGLFPLGSEGKSTAPTHGSPGSAPFLFPSSPFPPPLSSEAALGLLMGLNLYLMTPQTGPGSVYTPPILCCPGDVETGLMMRTTCHIWESHCGQHAISSIKRTCNPVTDLMVRLSLHGLFPLPSVMSPGFCVSTADGQIHQLLL